MDQQMLFAIILFLAIYILIISEKVHRTVIALLGAIIALSCGLISQKQALTYIDFNTLGLLLGMMIIVNITGKTGLFNYLAVWVAKRVKGDPVKLLFAFSMLTMVSSAYLDNVTTVFLMVPVIFSITDQLQVAVTPFLISQILAANIGGAATLIGDPPNIMIGSAVGFDFMDFIYNLAPISVLLFIFNMAVLYFIYGKKLKTTQQLKMKVMRLNEKHEITEPGLLKKCLFCLLIVITLFMLHGSLQMETATAALLGASLLLAMTYSSNEEALSVIFGELEWLTIFFFIGLFVLVGMLVETGIIKEIALKAIELTQGDVEDTAVLILWLSAVASAFIDNIPFVATMLPLLHEMGTMGIGNLTPVYWSLALGACIGGTGTLIGSSANVVVASMAAQRGNPILFLKYLRIAFPLMLFSIAISCMYILLTYF